MTSNRIDPIVDVLASQSKGVISAIVTHQRFKVLDNECGDGIWRIEPCPVQSNMQCSVMQKGTKHFCEAKIISKISIYGIPAACYDGLWCVAKKSPIVRHKFWFCTDDLILCVGFHSRKCAVDRPIIPSIGMCN
jgi:hypothetical protein